MWSLLFLGGRSADEKGELELLIGFPRDTRAYFLLKFTAPYGSVPKSTLGRIFKSTSISMWN